VLRELADRRSAGGGYSAYANSPIPVGEGRPAEPILELVTKKPVVPGPEEISRNPASRSAKLRVASKLGGDPYLAGESARKADGAAGRTTV